MFVGFPDADLPIGSAASLEQGKLERKLEQEDPYLRSAAKERPCLQQRQLTLQSDQPLF